MDCGTGLTRFTPVPRTRSVLVCERDAKRLINAVNGGILSLNQDSAVERVILCHSGPLLGVADECLEIGAAITSSTTFSEFYEDVRWAKFSAIRVLFSEMVKVPFNVWMKIAKRWAEEFKYAVLVVAREIGVIVVEMTAIRGRYVVFRVNTLNLGRIVKVLVRADTIADDDRFSEFFLYDAVNGFSSSSVLQDS